MSGRPSSITPGAARTAAHTFESGHWESQTPDFRNTPSRVDGVMGAIKDGAADAMVTAGRARMAAKKISERVANKSTDMKESAKRGVWRAGTRLAYASAFVGAAIHNRLRG